MRISLQVMILILLVPFSVAKAQRNDSGRYTVSADEDKPKDVSFKFEIHHIKERRLLIIYPKKGGEVYLPSKEFVKRSLDKKYVIEGGDEKPLSITYPVQDAAHLDGKNGLKYKVVKLISVSLFPLRPRVRFEIGDQSYVVEPKKRVKFR